MARFCKELSDDARVITLLNLIADTYGCKVDIDPVTRTVKFHCLPNEEVFIAAAIAEYFDCEE